MKKSAGLSLSHSVDKCVEHMVKFNNRLLASLPEAVTTPDHLNDVEFLKGNLACAVYLRCGLSTIKNLKHKGIISSFIEHGYSWYRISEIEAAKSAHPEAFNFRVYSAPPKKSLPKIYSKCIIASKDVMFITFSFKGVKYANTKTPDMINDQPAIYRSCVEILRLYNKLEPFVFVPE